MTSILSREQLTDMVLQELRIVKHLATKIPDGTLDYRPTPKQRSTLELLQFLSHNFSTAAAGILAGDRAVFTDGEKASASVTHENFAATVDANAEMFKATMAQFDAAELAKEVDLFSMGVTSTKASLLVTMLLKQYTAYKMQLFLYIKASGNASLNTMNVWFGVDAPMEE